MAKYGFPYLEEHLDIGLAMLSLVRLYKRTNDTTAQSGSATNTR